MFNKPVGMGDTREISLFTKSLFDTGVDCVENGFTRTSTCFASSCSMLPVTDSPFFSVKVVVRNFSSMTFEGLITDTDLHGEKPMRLVAERGSHFDELTVGDVMTGISSLDAIDFDLLKRASVGDLIATLERFGRNHLLVVERQSGTDACSVCGIVSRAQIERQTGLVVQTTHIASTFAEVERALF